VWAAIVLGASGFHRLMAQAHFSWQQPGSHQIMMAGKSMPLEKDSMTIREPKRQRLDPFGGPHPEGDPYVDQRGFMTRSIHAGAFRTSAET
jgi:hypothetical protein